MIKGSEVVRIARTYLDVPFHHQGRNKNVGIDCIGLIVGVAKELDLFEYDNTNYPRYSDGKLLMQEMLKVFTPVDLGKEQPGDVLIYWIDPRSRHPQHVGIRTNSGIIHTYDRVQKVVETRLGTHWDERITHAFRYPGVA